MRACIQLQFKMTNQFLLSFDGTKFNTSNKSRNNCPLLFEVNVSKYSARTIKLFALDFYEVIVDEAEAHNLIVN